MDCNLNLLQFLTPNPLLAQSAMISAAATLQPGSQSLSACTLDALYTRQMVSPSRLATLRMVSCGKTFSGCTGMVLVTMTSLNTPLLRRSMAGGLNTAWLVQAYTWRQQRKARLPMTTVCCCCQANPCSMLVQNVTAISTQTAYGWQEMSSL